MKTISLIDRVIADIPRVGIETEDSKYKDELKYTCDSRVILDELRKYEIEIPSDIYEKYKDEFGNGVLQYMESLANKSMEDFEGQNTYNWNGRIIHDFDYRVADTDDTYYVAIQVHRSGDVRCNYTDFVLFGFEYPEQWFDVVCEICTQEFGNSRVVDDKTYFYDMDIFSESLRVYCEDNGENYDIYAYDDESFDEEIRKKS